MNVNSIAEGIRWFMEDNCLDRNAGFDVVTEFDGEHYETVIFGVDAEAAVDALAEYLQYNPSATTWVRENGNYLVVSQPAT